MKQIPDELLKLSKDIKYLRSLLNQNREYIRKIIYMSSFRIYLWFTSAFILIFSILFYYFINYYRGYLQIPLQIRVILISAGCLSFLVMAFIKVFIFKNHGVIGPEVSIFTIAVKTIGKPMIEASIIHGALTVYLSVYFCITGSYQIVFAVITIAAGLLYTMMGTIYSLFEFLLAGLLLVIGGSASIPFIIAAPFTTIIWIGGTFSISLFTLVFSIEIMQLFNNKMLRH